MTPYVGMRFQHSRVLDGAFQPMVCVVTRIAQGTVYYRPVSGGHPQCCEIESFDRWCRRVLS